MAETRSANSEPVEAWITGIGLATSLSEGLDAHWDALSQRRINVDEKGFAPYIVHPLAPVTFDTQIPKKGDQRQMEAWQRIGTYAAGLALDSAGVKGNKDILARMDMIVAAGGGERDLAVDSGILNSEAHGASSPGFLNERLMNDLRPTLFLAQLSNLLAGNIAIVHGVTGSSRTFMGEEAAGVDAARIALARIAAGQSDIALVGAAHNGERKDLLMLYEFGDFNLKDKFEPVWAREKRSGFALGSGGAFLVIESKAHAQARGAKPYARLTNVVADQARRKASGRGHGIAGNAVVEARQAQGQGRHHHRRHRRRAGHLRRTGFPRASIRILRCAPPARRLATPWKPSFRLGSASPRWRFRAAPCFRRTIRPDSRLKCPRPPPRLW